MENLYVTILGAAGKMGSRIVEKLLGEPYHLLLCEKGEKGLSTLQERGFVPTPQEEAVPKSDIIIMAVPDKHLEEVSSTVVPLMKRGGIMVYLDATIPYFGNVLLRDDCGFVVVHPCHPPLFLEDTDPRARGDFFGGIAKQDIVMALIKGDDEVFATAQKICEKIFAPVSKVYRIGLEHMALLEPGAAEVVAIPALQLIKEAIDEVVERGVPREAALAFMLGHVRVALAILLGFAPFQFSDACQVALKKGYEFIIRPDWRKVFELGVLRSIADEMIGR